MRKLFTVIIALVAFTQGTMALEYEPEPGFSAMGFIGMNATKINNLGYDGKVGGVFGFRMDYVLPKAHGTYMTAGIDWTMKGAKLGGIQTLLTDGRTPDATDKYCLNYLEIPVRVGFRYNFSKELGVFGEFGPYFAMGITGKHKFDVDADGPAARAGELVFREGTKQSYNAFKKKTFASDGVTPADPNFQRWDAGLGFRVGAEYNQHYSLMLGCDWGLTDMWLDDWRDAAYGKPGFNVADSKIKNFNFTIAFGYRF